MQHFRTQKTDLGKKEIKQDAALAILEKLFLKGKINDVDDPILTKKHIKSRIKECEKICAEKNASRIKKFKKLDQYGGYDLAKASTKLADLKKCGLLMKGLEGPALDPQVKHLQNGLKQFFATWTLTMRWPGCLDETERLNWFRIDAHEQFRKFGENVRWFCNFLKIWKKF